MKVIKLNPGEVIDRKPNKPILSMQYGYLWIGNDADDNKFCFATLSGKKTLLKLAKMIRDGIK